MFYKLSIMDLEYINTMCVYLYVEMLLRLWQPVCVYYYFFNV